MYHFMVRTRVKGMSPLLSKSYQHLGWVHINPEYLEVTKHSRETGWFLHLVLSKILKRRPEFLVSQERYSVLPGAMGKAQDVRRRLSTIKIWLEKPPLPHPNQINHS